MTCTFSTFLICWDFLIAWYWSMSHFSCPLGTENNVHSSSLVCRALMAPSACLSNVPCWFCLYWLFEEDDFKVPPLWLFFLYFLTSFVLFDSGQSTFDTWKFMTSSFWANCTLFFFCIKQHSLSHLKSWSYSAIWYFLANLPFFGLAFTPHIVILSIHSLFSLTLPIYFLMPLSSKAHIWFCFLTLSSIMISRGCPFYFPPLLTFPRWTAFCILVSAFFPQQSPASKPGQWAY